MEALEPVISAETISFHHGTFQAYVDLAHPSASEGCSFGKEPKVMFISLMQEKRNQRVHYPQGPLHRGMQPLLLSLLHFGKLGPSKVPLGGYRLRWTLVDDVSVGWDHPLDL